MNKPTTLLIEEFKQNLTSTINNASLPPFIVEYILKEYLTEISSIAVDSAKQEISEYYKKLEEEKASEKETIDEP